jgi:hypothetical protein
MSVPKRIAAEILLVMQYIRAPLQISNIKTLSRLSQDRETENVLIQEKLYR